MASRSIERYQNILKKQVKKNKEITKTMVKISKKIDKKKKNYHLFLDVTDNLPFSGGGEAVSSLGQDFHQIISEVTASQIQPGKK